MHTKDPIFAYGKSLTLGERNFPSDRTVADGVAMATSYLQTGGKPGNSRGDDWKALESGSIQMEQLASDAGWKNELLSERCARVRSALLPVWPRREQVQHTWKRKLEPESGEFWGRAKIAKREHLWDSNIHLDDKNRVRRTPRPSGSSFHGEEPTESRLKSVLRFSDGHSLAPSGETSLRGARLGCPVLVPGVQKWVENESIRLEQPRSFVGIPAQESRDLPRRKSPNQSNETNPIPSLLRVMSIPRFTEPEVSATRFSELTPRFNELTSRIGELTPRFNELTSRIGELTPRLNELTPRFTEPQVSATRFTDSHHSRFQFVEHPATTVTDDFNSSSESAEALDPRQHQRRLHSKKNFLTRNLSASRSYEVFSGSPLDPVAPLDGVRLEESVSNDGGRSLDGVSRTSPPGKMTSETGLPTQWSQIASGSPSRSIQLKDISAGRTAWSSNTGERSPPARCSHQPLQSLTPDQNCDDEEVDSLWKKMEDSCGRGVAERRLKRPENQSEWNQSAWNQSGWDQSKGNQSRFDQSAWKQSESDQSKGKQSMFDQSTWNQPTVFRDSLHDASYSNAYSEVAGHKRIEVRSEFMKFTGRAPGVPERCGTLQTGGKPTFPGGFTAYEYPPKPHPTRELTASMEDKKDSLFREDKEVFEYPISSSGMVHRPTYSARYKNPLYLSQGVIHRRKARKSKTLPPLSARLSISLANFGSLKSIGDYYRAMKPKTGACFRHETGARVSRCDGNDTDCPIDLTKRVQQPGQIVSGNEDSRLVIDTHADTVRNEDGGCCHDRLSVGRHRDDVTDPVCFVRLPGGRHLDDVSDSACHDRLPEGRHLDDVSDSVCRDRLPGGHHLDDVSDSVCHDRLPGGRHLDDVKDGRVPEAEVRFRPPSCGDELEIRTPSSSQPSSRISSPDSVPDCRLPPKKRRMPNHWDEFYRATESNDGKTTTTGSDAFVERNDRLNALTQISMATGYLGQEATNRRKDDAGERTPVVLQQQNRCEMKNRKSEPEEDFRLESRDRDDARSPRIIATSGSEHLDNDHVTNKSRCGTPVYGKNSNKKVAHQLAAISNQLRTVDELFRESTSPNATDGSGDSCLQLPAKYRKPYGVSHVVRSHVTDSEVTNYDGSTALQLSVMPDDLEQVRVLLRVGASGNAVDDTGERTPQRCPVKRNDSAASELLMSSRSIPSLTTFSGCAPGQVSSGRSHLDVAKMLRRSTFGLSYLASSKKLLHVKEQ